MPGQRNIDDFASADKPIPVHDFAEALRSQAISAGHSDTIQGIDDKRIVQNFIKNIAPGMPKWKPLVDAKSLSFEMAAESAAPPAPSGPPTAASTSATPAAPTGTTPPPKAPAEPGLDERLKAKAEGPPSVGGVAAAAVRPLLHPFTNPLETLGFGSMKSYEQTKHAEKRAQVGVEGQAPPKTTEELYKNYPNLIEPGNIDLLNRPVVKNKDGTSSTVSTMTIDEDGRGILLPTVINGKHVSDGEAREHYQQTGEHMGIFKTEQDADEFDKSLHNRMGWKGPKGSDQQKWQDSSGAPVSKSERFADQAMEEIAGLGDAIVSPVGLITAGFGPEIRAAAKSKGAGWIIRKLGVAEKLTRLGFGGLQLANAVHAMTEFYEDPTPENAAKAIADSGIGALAVAPEAIGVGKAVGRTAKGAAEIAGNITKPGRLGAAVKAGAEGFKRGAAGEPEAPEPTGPPRKAATPTGPPKADSDENYILDEHGNRVQTKGTEAPGDEKTDEDAIAKIIEGVAKKHGATVTRGTLPLDSASTRKPTVPAPKAEKSDLVTRTREVKATKPERLEKTEERGPELPKAISGAAAESETMCRFHGSDPRVGPHRHHARGARQRSDGVSRSGARCSSGKEVRE